MFNIDSKVYSSMFGMPTDVADKCLKFANGEQLKVVIAIFRNPDLKITDIADKTSLPLDTVNECVEFWEDMGILKPSEKVPFKTEKEAHPKMETQKAPLMEIHFVNPTQKEINEILEQNGAMKRLFNEAQEILGKTIGYNMQCVLYSIVNYYGITPDVANCLLYFARSVNCTSQNDIQKIAKFWAENNITDILSADEYITEATKANELFYLLAEKTNNSASTPSFSILEIIAEWIRWGYNIDTILKAYQITKEEKQTGKLNWNNFRHMNGIIKRWRSSNIYTLEDIEKGTKKFTTKSQSNKNNGKETSFDVDLAEENARSGNLDLINKKGRKRSKEA